MFVVVVTARGSGPGLHWSEALGRRVAVDLVARGHQVTWLRPVPGPDLPTTAHPGLDIRDFVAAPPPFRRVEARGEDALLDVALARLLRERPATAVIHLGLGAVGSVQPLWLAERMGSAPIAVIAAREALCHRGTLLTGDGAECRIVDDPDRCWQCLATPSRDGLGLGAARAMRWLRHVPGSPFPGREQFQNRLDLVVASLQVARLVAVVDPALPTLLEHVGVPARVILHTAADSQAFFDRIAESLLDPADPA